MFEVVSKNNVTLSYRGCHEDVTIIDRCGEFPNVPLLGIRGGITYNPSLALHDNLAMLEEMVPTMHSFKALYSTTRMMFKVIVKDLYELRER